MRFIFKNRGFGTQRLYLSLKKYFGYVYNTSSKIVKYKTRQTTAVYETLETIILLLIEYKAEFAGNYFAAECYLFLYYLYVIRNRYRRLINAVC